MKKSKNRLLLLALLLFIVIGAISIYAMDVDEIKYNPTSAIDISNYEAGKLYLWDYNTQSYVTNPSTKEAPYEVLVGEKIKVMAIIENPTLGSDGKPDIEQSDIWSFGKKFSDELEIKTEWNQVEETKWQITAECIALKEGQATTGVFYEDKFILNLSINGEPQKDTFFIKATDTEQTKIHISNIVIGTNTYNDVDRNTATRMFNGKNNSKNTYKNRYTVYVGDTLDISADVPQGYTFYSDEIGNLISNVTYESSWAGEDDGKLKASLLAFTEGDCEIYLRNEQNKVEEVIYISVRNPISINTAIGEVRKDNIHEYVFTALKWMYDSDPDKFITDPENTPMYVKNQDRYLSQYYMYQDETVILSTIASTSDEHAFEPSEGVEAVKDATIENIDNGFKKITQEFKITSTGNKVVNIKFGQNVFYIFVQEEKINFGADHFDIEATVTHTYKQIDATTTGVKQTETVYESYVSGVNLCQIYGEDDEGKEKLLGTIEIGEYWKRLFDVNNVQFEITSAYETKDERLINKDGEDIDDDVRNNRTLPVVKERNEIKADDVKKVVFNVDFFYVPRQLTTETGKLDENNHFVGDGNKETIVYTEDNQPESIISENNVVEMNERDIIDALNRCPGHSGFDFKVGKIEEKLNYFGDLAISKSVEGKNIDKEKEFNFEVRLNDKENKICKDINGEYGELQFNEGIANITLKDGEIKEAQNLPADLNYVVEELNNEKYEVTATGEIGTIPKMDTVEAKFINTEKTGALTIVKKVEGDAGDTNKLFNFVVELKDSEGNPLEDEYEVKYNENTEAQKIKDGDTIQLKHGQMATILELPENTKYKVAEVEANKDDYTTTAKDEEGSIKYNETSIVTFTNKKDKQYVTNVIPTPTSSGETTKKAPVETDYEMAKTGGTALIAFGGFAILFSIVGIALGYKKNNKK